MMRFTIIDEHDTISFVAPPHALKAIAAACAGGIRSASGILEALESYDGDLAKRLKDELSIFREHNTSEDFDWIALRLGDAPDYEAAFDVLDERTRRTSLEPARLGLVIFNLPERRIVQVQNSYANLERADRGRVRRNGKPISAYYRYTLPDDWTIVP